MSDTAPAAEATTPAGKSLTWHIGMIALVGVVAIIVIGLIALTLARYDIISKLAGFRWFVRPLYAALACGAIGAVAVALGAWRKTGPKWPGILAIGLAAALFAVIWITIRMPASAHPPMHDITTDLNEPPQFANWTLREDNLVPFNSMEEWRAAHRQNYPQIQPAVIDKPPVEVLADARALAEERGWEIVETDAKAGRLEAIAFAGYLRFRDHVVVEVIPIADGSTRVDMRSVSEVGVSDLGYNAKRIEEFLTALRAG